MNKYPDAKVILTVRDADKWYDSVYKTCYPSQQAFDYRSKDFPRLGKLKRMNETTVLDGAFGDPERMNDRETIIRMFNERNEWVKANVPADRLLVMELGVDGWEKLCAFLGKEVPDEPYPKSNSRQEFEEMMRLFIQDGQDGRAVMESAMAQLKRQKSTTWSLNVELFVIKRNIEQLMRDKSLVEQKWAADRRLLIPGTEFRDET